MFFKYAYSGFQVGVGFGFMLMGFIFAISLARLIGKIVMSIITGGKNNEKDSAGSDSMGSSYRGAGDGFVFRDKSE